MKKQFSSHEIVWTKEKVSRFWDFYSSQLDLEHMYFSQQVGEALIDFVRKYIRLQGNILDYGCGPGFLIEKLLRNRVLCWGLDSSESSAQTVEKKFGGNPFFKDVIVSDGLPLPVEDEKFDAIFLVETIEHLLSGDLMATLKELHRITRLKGNIVVTTVNNENLDESKVMCPECGCVFHKMQHVSSWTVGTLSNLMAEAGFQKIACTTTTFKPKSLWGYYKKVTDTIRNQKPVNLIYVGQKAIDFLYLR